jgi:hypothetical protein
MGVLSAPLSARVLAPLACALLIGCASPPFADKNLLAFLDHDAVTREKVHSRLGDPRASFEHERVLTYRLSHSSRGYGVDPRKSGWEGVTYDLVVEFDEHDLVRKHSLVTIRAP